MAWVQEQENLEEIERFFRKGREWLKKKHEEGIWGTEYVQQHSALMDNVIRRLFKRAIVPLGGQNSGLALLATGGYGREELNPYSDIDLLLVHLPGKGKNLGEWLSALLHPLWDWGLTVGYTVQTPKEGWRAAQKDLELFLAFLDARRLAGDKETVLAWEGEFSRGLAGGKDTEVLLQIRQMAQTRYAHNGDSVFVLEPDIKEGNGGLRDYHSAFWAARIKHGVKNLEELVEKGLLAEREWQVYSRALGFLWRVRNQIHYAHGREEDRLSFEDQEMVARAFGYLGDEPQLATESFLKEYFTHALRVHQLSWNLLEKCLNEGTAGARSWGTAGPAEIAPGFFQIGRASCRERVYVLV